MNNKCIRTIDAQGRICIPKDILELANIANESELLLVQEQEDMILLAKNSEINSINKPIVGKINVGSQKRMVIPMEFRGDKDFIECFYLNGYVVLR